MSDSPNVNNTPLPRNFPNPVLFEENKQVGRPSLYKQEYCPMVVEHMKKGLSFPSFGSIINVSVDTLYEWAKVHPEFSEAKKVGEAHSLMFWEQMGIGGAVGQIDKFNSTAWIFNMKNKHNWRDKTDITSDNEAILPPDLLNGQAIKAMLKGMMMAAASDAEVIS